MPRKTVAEISKETLQLQEYVMSKPKGTALSYDRIEADTNIVMNEANKQKLRNAIRRAGLEYATIHSFGVKIADHNMVMPILSNKIVKIDRAVKRADRTQKNLQEQFFDSLDPKTQKQVLYAGAVFGAIRVAAENGRLLYNTKTKKINNEQVSIPLPNFEDGV